MGQHKGYKQTEEHIKKRIANHIGAKRSIETCKNISKAKKGKRINQSVNQIRDWNGINNPRWHGGIRMERENYILIKSLNHPYANKEGYVREHRLIMEQYLRRFLTPKEVVHHLDHNPLNNAIENLWLFSSHKEHQKYERMIEKIIKEELKCLTTI